VWYTMGGEAGDADLVVQFESVSIMPLGPDDIFL